MAINIIVEDLTGLDNANVYCSIEEYKQFAELNGYDLPEDDEIAIFLVRASNFIDSNEKHFVGKRLNPSQALAFPRVYDGYFCGKTPHLYSMHNLKKAVLYAVYAQSEGFNLLPISVSKDDFVSKEKIEGAIEVQYSSEYFSKNLIAKFPMVEKYLSEYIISLGGQLKVIR